MLWASGASGGRPDFWRQVPEQASRNEALAASKRSADLLTDVCTAYSAAVTRLPKGWIVLV